LRKNEFIDAYTLSQMYSKAQLYDSMLVLMNQVMILEFTQISRMISLIFKIIAMTAYYLGFIVI